MRCFKAFLIGLLVQVVLDVGSLLKLVAKYKRVIPVVWVLVGNAVVGLEGLLWSLSPGALKNKGQGKGKEALPSRGQCGFGSPQESTRVPKPNPTPEDLTSGDSRAIVQPTLTSMHTLFLQEHNRIVDALLPLWNAHTDTKRLSTHTREDFIFEVGSFEKVVRNLFRTRHSKMCTFCI